ncbi:MAG: hypothetical protein ACKVQB_04260 [Bacteroidia bacterium]
MEVLCQALVTDDKQKILCGVLICWVFLIRMVLALGWVPPLVKNFEYRMKLWSTFAIEYYG